MAAVSKNLQTIGCSRHSVNSTQILKFSSSSKCGLLWWKLFWCKVGILHIIQCSGLMLSVMLQMRLYALYNRSRKLLFVVVLGFVIEIVIALVTVIRISIFDGQSPIDNSWKTDCELHCLKSTVYY